MREAVMRAVRIDDDFFIARASSPSGLQNKKKKSFFHRTAGVDIRT